MCGCARVCVGVGVSAVHTIHTQEQLHCYHILFNESDKDDGTNIKQMQDVIETCMQCQYYQLSA